MTSVVNMMAVGHLTGSVRQWFRRLTLGLVSGLDLRVLRSSLTSDPELSMELA